MLLEDIQQFRIFLNKIIYPKAYKCYPHEQKKLQCEALYQQAIFYAEDDKGMKCQSEGTKFNLIRDLQEMITIRKENKKREKIF